MKEKTEATSDGRASLSGTVDTVAASVEEPTDTGSNAGASTDPAHNAQSVPPSGSSIRLYKGSVILSIKSTAKTGPIKPAGQVE